MFSFNIINKKESTLLAVYDLEKINCSFDFIIFFQNAILYQKKNNIKKLDLCLVKGSVNGFKKYQFLREKENVLENALFRLNNIVIPSIMMFRKYYDNFFLINDRKHADEFFRKYKNFFPKGYNLNCEKRDYINQSIWKNLEKNYKDVELAKLDVSEHLSQKILKKINTSKRIISITLRESSYHEHRNSLIREWKNFVTFLEKKNYFVIVIRDSEKIYLDNFFENNNLFPQASYDLYLRSSIYKASYINYFVSCGPSIVCWCNDYKSVSFNLWGIEQDRASFEDNMGLERDEESKILDKNNHFLLSEADTFSNLSKFHENFFLNDIDLDIK